MLLQSIFLKHPVRYTEPWHIILKDVSDLPTWETNIENHCSNNYLFLNDDEHNKKQRTLKGDALELLIEMLFKTHPCDNINLKISNYRPHHPQFGDNDYGVDGSGISTINQRVATVQVKYRPAHWVLTANKDHLVNFKNSSCEDYSVEFTDKDNMLIVTNCVGVHPVTMDKMLNNKVRCIGRETLIEMIDSNSTFWDSFRAATTPVDDSL